MKLRDLRSANVKGKRVLIRLDLNVPLKNGQIQDDSRLQAVLPTLNHLLQNSTKVIVMTHLGRPEGQVVPELRVDPLATALSTLLGQKVLKLDDCVGPEVEKACLDLKEGEIILLENTRFHPEEEANEESFSKTLAHLGEIYVNDAFGTVHRGHASTLGVTQYLPSYAGFLIQREVEVLSQILESPKRPFCLIAGGAKIDTKIGILEKFISKADDFLIGGALANTFLTAQHGQLGDSLYEPEKLDVAEAFLKRGASVHLPIDLVVASEISNEAVTEVVSVDQVQEGQKVLDLGPETLKEFVKVIENAQTILWNGPMGLYEYQPFQEGTRAICEAVAKNKGTTVLGGGDTLDAIKAFGFDESDFTHVSTGGGAMLEFMEGKVLPALTPLMEEAL